VIAGEASNTLHIGIRICQHHNQWYRCYYELLKLWTNDQVDHLEHVTRPYFVPQELPQASASSPRAASIAMTLLLTGFIRSQLMPTKSQSNGRLKMSARFEAILLMIRLVGALIWLAHDC
jgi:hypothetical protein